MIESTITCVQTVYVISVPMQLIGHNLRFNVTFLFIRQKISPVEKFAFSTVCTDAENLSHDTLLCQHLRNKTFVLYVKEILAFVSEPKFCRNAWF